MKGQRLATLRRWERDFTRRQLEQLLAEQKKQGPLSEPQEGDIAYRMFKLLGGTHRNQYTDRRLARQNGP